MDENLRKTFYLRVKLLRLKSIIIFKIALLNCLQSQSISSLDKLKQLEIPHSSVQSLKLYNLH